MWFVRSQCALGKGVISYSCAHGCTSCLQTVHLCSYTNIFWNSSTKQSGSCPLAPHPPLPALPLWFTVHLRCRSCLQGCAKNRNVTEVTSISCCFFEVNEGIFKPGPFEWFGSNKQLPQHKCHVRGSIWAGRSSRAIWQEIPKSPLLPQKRNGSTPLEACELPNAFAASSWSSRRARMWIC